MQTDAVAAPTTGVLTSVIMVKGAIGGTGQVVDSIAAPPDLHHRHDCW